MLLLVDASIPPMALDISCAAWFAEAEVGAPYLPVGTPGLQALGRPGWSRCSSLVAKLPLQPCMVRRPHPFTLPHAAPPFRPHPPQIPFTVVFTKLDKRKKGGPPAEENIAAFEAQVRMGRVGGSHGSWPNPGNLPCAWVEAVRV